VPADRPSSVGEKIEEAQQLIARLSGLEKEVLAALIDGHSVKSIATALSLAPSEVVRAKGSLMRRLSALRNADAVRIGIYGGIGRPPWLRRA
jgi:FixJ family two-component response regulator